MKLLLNPSILLALTLTPLLAHDMWIEPSTFFPEPGQTVGIKLKVGQDLLGDPLPRSPELINQFVAVDGSGRRPVVGRNGGDPAGYLRVTADGLIVAGYFSNPSRVDLTAEKFNSYLKDEGLDNVAALRARRNETGKAVHEMFTRCAKSLVLAGAPAEGQADRQLGFALEVVAERNPYTMKAGDDLPLRLTYEKQALAGALLIAMNRLNPAEKVTARSDKDGRARLRLRSGGMWMIKAVHMVPAPAGSNADWASFWASLTFELKSASAPKN